MKTIWTASKGIIAGSKRRLWARRNTEHVMSFNRFVFCVLVSAFFNGAGIGPPSFGPALFVVGMLLTLGIFAHLLLHPEPNAGRRGFALIADMTAICLMLHVGDERAAVLFPMILWTIFGYGLRLGLPWLCAATAAGFSGFCLVAATTPFWSDHVTLTAGLAIGLVVLPAYAGILIRDMTRAKRQAEAANEAKNAFLANVSHELRTPLQAIIGTSDLLNGTELTPEQADFSRTIAGASRSLLRMIDDLLDVSRIEAGGVAAEEVEFDVVALLEEVRSLMLASCHAKGLRFALHVGVRTPPRVRGDRRHVREILVNLAANAVKFTPDGGVLLSVDPAGSEEGRPMLVFALTDTGIGVPAEARERIFERFTQADGTVAGRFGGTGLGLAICKRLVVALGGRIGVRDAPGRGSTFWFQIPVTPAAPIPPEACLDRLPLTVVLPGGAAERRLARAAALRRCRVRYVAPDAAPADAVPVSRAVEDALAEGRCVILQTPRTERARRELEAVVASADGPAHPAVVLVGGAPACACAFDLRWLGPVHLADGFTDDEVAAALAIAAVLSRRHAPAPAPVAAPGRRCHVLVADDNRTNRLVLSKILESGGHTCEAVGDGDAALTALEDGGYDLVLMDVNMPGTDGIEATKLRRFAESGQPHVPIVGLTADASPGMARRCKDAGMDACVTKPVSAAELLDVVERLAEHGARAEAGASRHPERGDGGGGADEEGVLDAYLLAGLEGVGGQHFVSEVTGEFTREAGATIRQMMEAVDEDDATKFRFNAHALASSAANVGAVGVRRLGLSLERMPESGIRGQGRERVRELIQELDRFVDALAARQMPRGSDGR